MNKKGFLLGEETLKIIIAVICIGFLVYFLVALYFANLSSSKLIQAQETLGRISEIISDSESFSESVDSINPAGWYVFGFVGEAKPNFCAGRECLCLCPKVFLGSQISKCDKKGACLIAEELNAFESFKIQGSGKTGIQINKLNGISISEK